eukprot:50195-Prymnesium_polylepis.1
MSTHRGVSTREWASSGERKAAALFGRVAAPLAWARNTPRSARARRHAATYLGDVRENAPAGRRGRRALSLIHI